MKNLKFLLVAALAAFVFLLSHTVAAQGQEDKLIQQTYEPFSVLLDRNLIEKKLENGGLVTAFDYLGALNDPETQRLLDRQAEKLAGFDTAKIDSKNTALAFWTNAYNFFMVYHILKNPENAKPVDSVKDFGHFLNPHKIFGQEIFNVGGRDYSLDEIEKEILLGDKYKEKGWKEARLHFAVNCASVGCPPLRKRIYLPSKMDEKMTENTRMALNTPRHLRIEGDTVYVTELFDWYESDFIEEEGSVKAFIRKYSDPSIEDRIDENAEIRFIDYDWSLNKPENFEEFKQGG